MKEGEIYDASEEDLSDSDEIITETIEEELQKLKDIQMNKITYNTSDVSFDTIQDKILDTNVKTNEHLDFTVNSSREELRNDHSSEFKEAISKATNAKKTGRVSFIEPYVMENVENKENIEEKISIPNEKSCFTSKQDKTCNDDSENEDDIVRIEFSHSSHIPNVSVSSNTEIQSPIDIYKMFNAPKSILKRSPNDMVPNQIAPLLSEESSTDTEDEVEHVKHSIYNSVSRNNLIILEVNNCILINIFYIR